MRTVAFLNLGCRENLLDGQLIASFFQSNGYELLDNIEEADYIVVNSCGFCETAERHSMQAYERALTSRKEGARIVFAGCLPAINKKLIRERGYDDVMITPRTISRFNSLLEASIPIESLQIRDLPFNPDARGVKGIVLGFTQRTAAFLKAIPGFPMPRWFWQALYLPTRFTEYIRISIGCLGKCAFCAVRRAKGATKSVPAEIIMHHFKDALSRGKKSIAFSCDELGSYGLDIGTSIVELLQRVTSIPGDYHLILRNTEPNYILEYWDKLKPIFASGKIGYVVMPMQSGSNKILKLMNRFYKAEDYLWLVKEMRKYTPKLLIRSHVMVGFPGETEDDFRESCNYIKELPIDHFKVHKYTERPYTPAAKMPDPVPDEIKEKRYWKMEILNIRCLLKGYRWFPMRP